MLLCGCELPTTVDGPMVVSGGLEENTLAIGTTDLANNLPAGELESPATVLLYFIA